MKGVKMQYCLKMQKAIEEICRRRNVNLNEDYVYLKIPSEHHTPLTIEKAGNTISVTYYVKNKLGDQFCNPSITFAITPKGWAPLRMSILLTGHIYSYRIGPGTAAENEQNLYRTTVFAEEWANQLRENYL